jgi:hypothetical protein
VAVPDLKQKPCSILWCQFTELCDKELTTQERLFLNRNNTQRILKQRGRGEEDFLYGFEYRFDFAKQVV